MDTLAALAKSALFRESFPGDFAPLAPALRTQTFEKGHFVWHAGDRAVSMFVIVSGQLNVSRLGPNGEEFVVDVFLPADTVGELAIFEDGLVRNMECLAAERTVCVSILRAPLLAFLERNPHVMLRMLSALARRIRNNDLHVSETSFQNIAGRVACKLLDLADAHGEAGADGVRLDIQLSQGTLANMVGASRENVNRALSRLISTKEIGRSGSTIVIPKPEEMRLRYRWMVP